MATALRLSSSPPLAVRVQCSAALAPPAAATNVSRVHLLSEGEWKGYGKRSFEITREHMESIVAQAQGQRSDIFVDWDHAYLEDPQAPASGWLKPLSISIEERGGTLGLWGDVEWLSDAAESIRRRAHKYFSAVLAFGRKDRKTAEPVLAELVGGALTNRPFIDGLEEVALSDRDLRRLLALTAQGGATMEDTTTEDPPKDAGAGNTEQMVMLGELVMQTLGLGSTEDTIAFLQENMGPEELAKALLERSGGGGEMPAEGPPEQVAASRQALLDRRLSRLEKGLLALTNTVEIARAEERVIADGVPRDHEDFGDMVRLSRAKDPMYEKHLKSIAAPTPPTERVVSLGRDNGREESSLSLAGLSAEERRLYDSMESTTLTREQKLDAVQRRRTN